MIDVLTPVLIIAIGLILVLIGLLMLVTRYKGKGVEKEYGAVIVIGPIPIIVGSSKKAAVIAGAVAVLVLLLILLLFM